MFHYCLLMVLLLILLLKQETIIEGQTGIKHTSKSKDQTGTKHTSKSVQQMKKGELATELKRIRDGNYIDASGFEAMMKKGICDGHGDAGDTNQFHSCKIEEATKTKPVIDVRYINPSPKKLHESADYTYLPLCLDRYVKTMDVLVSEQLKPHPELYKMTLDPTIPNPKNFFKNEFSRGQYPGYTHNNYLDRTRYIRSEEPLPVNPDFFMDGGGTYA